MPCCIRISGDGWALQRHAVDDYAAPFTEVASAGAFNDLVAARALRADHGLPAQAFGAAGPTPELKAHLAAARARLTAAITAAETAGDEDGRLVLARRLAQIGRPPWPFGAIVAWRFPLRGSECVAQVPEGVPAPVTNSPWWLELLSTGFDPDAGCALVRGVLHAPLDAHAGPPPWQMGLDTPGVEAEVVTMPVDSMGVRPGR